MPDAAAPTLAYDLPCRRCRYNLRTLATDARCPECGTPVAVTLGLEPKNAPLLDTPALRRRVARGCFALASVLPLFVLSNCIVRAVFHNSGIFWKIDPPYLLGPVSLLFAASIGVLCLAQKRVDGAPAYRLLRGATVLLALCTPASIASWEIGYAFAPFYRYDAYVQISVFLAAGGPLSVGLALLLLASVARELRLPDVTVPLAVFALVWFLTFPLAALDMTVPHVWGVRPRSLLGRFAEWPWLANFLGIFTLAETCVLLLCTGVVLRHSARLREAALESAAPSSQTEPSSLETLPS